MTGTVASWVIDARRRVRWGRLTSLDDVLEHLLATLAPGATRANLASALETLHFDKAQTLGLYLMEFLQLVSRLHKIDQDAPTFLDAVRLEGKHFLRGVAHDPDLIDKLLKEVGPTFSDLADIDALRGFCTSYDERIVFKNGLSRLEHAIPTLAAVTEQQQQQQQPQQPPTFYNPDRSPPRRSHNGNCHKCGHPGHFSRSCITPVHQRAPGFPRFGLTGEPKPRAPFRPIGSSNSSNDALQILLLLLLQQQVQLQQQLRSLEQRLRQMDTPSPDPYALRHTDYRTPPSSSMHPPSRSAIEMSLPLGQGQQVNAVGEGDEQQQQHVSFHPNGLPPLAQSPPWY